MNRLTALIGYIALLAYITAPALATQCHPADYSLPATAHNSKVAKLTKRAKKALSITILSHKPHYILIRRANQKTYRFYLSHSKGTTQAYSNGRYIIFYAHNNYYYIKRQPSPYTVRLICED